MPVVLLGTLDTKGVEFQFVRDLLHAARPAPRWSSTPASRGRRTSRRTCRASRCSPRPARRWPPSSRPAIAARRSRPPRGASPSSSPICTQQGKVDGILGLGGSAGTTIGTAAMRALPFGVPKLMVSTLASGQVRPYVGVRDILMMHSVVDISGLNRISRTVLTNAANAMIGMVHGQARRGQRPRADERQAADRRDHVRRHHALRRGGPQAAGSRPATKCSSSTPPAPAA